MQSLFCILKNMLNFMPKTVIAMNNKSILMPHACQKIGWWFLFLTALIVVAKVIISFTTHNIDVVWYLAKSSHLILIAALFFITLSKEKVEDEMISGLRLKAIGLTGYVFFVVFLLLSLALELHMLDVLKSNDGTLSLYLSELFLIVLPIMSAGLYYFIFRVLLRQSKKERAL